MASQEKRAHYRKRDRQFISVQALSERWGCTVMFIEKRLRSDPDFPKIYAMGRHRRFDVEELERYEQKSVVSKYKSK